MNTNRLAIWIKLIPQDKLSIEFEANVGQPLRRVCAPSWNTLRHVSRDVAHPARRSVQPAAMGHGRRRRPVLRAEGLGRAARRYRARQPDRLDQPRGRIVTAGGLVITSGAQDNALHVFDANSGEEIWKFDLPASAQA